MRRPRAGAAGPPRSYLHLNMRPLSVGALEPNRSGDGDHTAAAVAVAAVALALVVLAPIVFFLSVFGDPYPRAFVERRADGFYALLRACGAPEPIYRVEVAPYNGSIELPDPFWVATRRGVGGADSVRLLSPQPGFDTSTTDSSTPTIYEVTINRNRLSESSVVVDELALSIGEVEFGGEPIPRADYDRMSNSNFGCPPP